MHAFYSDSSIDSSPGTTQETASLQQPLRTGVDNSIPMGMYKYPLHADYRGIQMKKSFFLLCVCLLAGTAAGYATLFTRHAPSHTFRVAIALPPDSHYYKGLEQMDSLMRQHSNGTLSLEIHPSAELGSESQMVEAVSRGSLDMTLSTTAPLALFTKAFMVFDLPFIIRDRARAYRWMDGAEGQRLLDSLADQNIVGLSIWESGFRHLTSATRPILLPEDVQGLHVRVMENPIHLATFRELGAHPTAIPFGDLYEALETKTVTAQENPLDIIETSHFYRVQHHLALTGHFYSPAVLMINRDVWKSLSQEQRTIIRDAAVAARDWERAYCRDLDARLLQTLKDRGMTVTEPDRAVWEKAVKPVYAQFEQTIGAQAIHSLIDAQQ